MQSNDFNPPFSDDNVPVNSFTVPAHSLISRRRVLGGGALAGLAILVGGAGGASAVTKKRTTTTKKKTTTRPVTTKAVTATTAATAVSPAGTFASTQEVAVTWTYKPTGGGRIHNPYVAVWVEDSDGVPVRIVHFEYQIGKGRRWINEMKRWARVDEVFVALGKESSADTTTSATRVPGTYSVAWDGKNADGDYVKNGKYSVYVEAAREKGPYQFVKTDVTLDGSAVKVTGTPSGELTAVSVALKAK